MSQLATPARRRPVATALLALLVGLALVPALQAPASAAEPTPATPSFPSSIDPYAPYVAESTCSPTEKPGVDAFRDLLLRTYGSTRWNNIVRSCSSSDSGHEEGRSLDIRFMSNDTADHAKAKALLDWLMKTDGYGNPHANARRLGIMYVQYNDKMWRSYRAQDGWQPQSSSCSSSTFSTACHDDHIHFSFGWDGAYAKTSWFQASPPRAVCPTSSPTNTDAPTVPTSAAGYVRLSTPPVILDTAIGLGQSSPCALGAPNRYDLLVEGVGGVPSSGVKAVHLLVASKAPSASLYVYAGPSGADFTTSGRAYAQSGIVGQASMTVPVGTDGKISLRLSSGTTDVVVTVLGYHASTGGAYVPVYDRKIYGLNSERVAAGAEAKVQLGGLYGVSSTARAAMVTVTGYASTGNTFLGAAAYDAAGTPNNRIFVPKGVTTSQSMLVPLDSSGAMALVNSGTYSTAAIVVVHGYVSSSAAVGKGRFVGLKPTTVLYTGGDIGHSGSFKGGERFTQKLGGVAGVPTGATAVVLDLTVLGSTTGGTWLTSYPAGGQSGGVWRHIGAGVKSSGLVVLPLASDGRLTWYAGPTAVAVVASTVGYIT